MTCPVCTIIQQKQGMLFEDEHLYVYLAPRPAVEGHMIVAPKQHYPILEQVPDSIAPRIFQAANILSVVAFETLGAQGSNILVCNGIEAGQTSPHFSVHVLPRRDNDGLNLSWKAEKASESLLSDIETKLREAAAYEEKPGVEPPKPQNEPEPAPAEEKKQEEDYLTRSLYRIP